jgi:hypothetical protein
MTQPYPCTCRAPGAPLEPCNVQHATCHAHRRQAPPAAAQDAASVAVDAVLEALRREAEHRA